MAESTPSPEQSLTPSVPPIPIPPAPTIIVTPQSPQPTSKSNGVTTQKQTVISEQTQGNKSSLTQENVSTSTSRRNLVFEITKALIAVLVISGDIYTIIAKVPSLELTALTGGIVGSYFFGQPSVANKTTEVKQDE